MLKNETVMLRICGSCAYAKGRPESEEMEKLERVFLRHQSCAYLALLRRSANLRDAKVFCRKENIEVGVLEEACAFWKEK